MLKELGEDLGGIKKIHSETKDVLTENKEQFTGKQE